MHKVKWNSEVTACGVAIGRNLQQMPDVLTVLWPKCLRCFRVIAVGARSAEEVDFTLKRARHS
eukprot:101384-Amphidinium_carterae.1